MARTGLKLKFGHDAARKVNAHLLTWRNCVREDFRNESGIAVNQEWKRGEGPASLREARELPTSRLLPPRGSAFPPRGSVSLVERNLYPRFVLARSPAGTNRNSPSDLLARLRHVG